MGLCIFAISSWFNLVQCTCLDICLLAGGEMDQTMYAHMNKWIKFSAYYYLS
jgi:hypothetical protein